MPTQPTFAHPVFERLFERDYFIADEVLREILALGPAAAVPELLKITDSTLDSFDYDDPAANWWASYYFLHALYLLHELRAPEALAVLHRLLRLDSEKTEYWFGDMLFEEVPALLARAGQARLPELLALLEDARMPLHHRLVVAGALLRLARTEPALRPAISGFLQHYLRHVVAHASQATLLFPADAGTYGYDLPAYLGMLLTEMQDADLRELEPEMRALHRLGLVDESIAGGEADLDFESRQPLPPDPDIFDRYQQLRADPDSYSPFHPDAAAIAARRAQAAQRQKQRSAAAVLARATQRLPPALAKTGRNDPCGCGSGKKYKKCCGA